MRFMILGALLVPMLVVVAIAAGPLAPAFLLAVGAFALVWVMANALLGLVLSAIAALRGRTRRLAA